MSPRHDPRTHAHGWSVVGMLITLVCILILFVIIMTALRQAIGAQGLPLMNTVRSVEDKMNLYAMAQSMTLYANDHDGWFPVPHQIADTDARELDTTAALYSAMIMHLQVTPAQLISGNERSEVVEIDEDYDFDAYDPGAGVFWDRQFVADLVLRSNASYAHLPMYGRRHERGWRQHSTSSQVPLMGTRGPEWGRPVASSVTCDSRGRWAGHLVFGDGHVEFFESVTPTNRNDNVFAWEEGPDGGDAILAFTASMDPRQGPRLQFD